MKLATNAKKTLIASVLATLVAGSTCFAQGFGGGNPGGLDENMMKLFGKNTYFTATTEIEMKQGPGGPMTMPMSLVVLDGKARMEIDMAQIKSASMPAAQLAQMKQMGMDKMTVISRPDLKTSFMIYPGLKSYIEMPTPAKPTGASDKSKIETTALSKETVDGHSCQKNKVVLTDASGKKTEVTVWNATDLKDFPIQMQLTGQGQPIVMKYKNVKFQKPEAKLFEAPADFKKYASMQEAMMSRMAPPQPK